MTNKHFLIKTWQKRKVLSRLCLALLLCSGSNLRVQALGVENFYGIHAIAATTAPTISLTGDAELTVEAGSTFTDPGVTASDAEDGDITSSIVVGGDAVDTNAHGTYVITYDVTDSDGNAAAQVTRTIHVKETLSFDITATTVRHASYSGRNSFRQRQL